MWQGHPGRWIAQQSWLRGPAGLRSSHQSFMCLEGTPWHAPHIAITLCFSHAVPCPHTHCALSRAARRRRGETHRSRAGCPLSSAHVARSLLLMMPCSTWTRRSGQVCVPTCYAAVPHVRNTDMAELYCQTHTTPLVCMWSYEDLALRVCTFFRLSAAHVL